MQLLEEWQLVGLCRMHLPEMETKGVARARLERALNHHHIPNDVKTYAGVGHSFANDLPGQAFMRIAGFGYDEEVTEDAYRRVFAFFGEHLDS
mgnify:CR=1 FL=1